MALLLAMAASALQAEMSGTPAPTVESRPPSAGVWTNSLGMRFVSVPGVPVRFCVWETRVQDFAVFVSATGHDTGDAMYVAGTNGWQFCPGRNWRNPGFPQTPRHPVVGVNWQDAREFSQWLTGHERRQGRIGDRDTYRLPTDIEWSAAVGLTNETGRNPQERFLGVPAVFPWGTHWPPATLAGNLASELGVDPFDRTAPVGSFAPNPLGIFDLAGNVAEWCEDAWNDEKPFRVLRSAPWNNDCRLCLMSSYRFVNLPEVRMDFYGFRVVLAISD